MHLLRAGTIFAFVVFFQVGVFQDDGELGITFIRIINSSPVSGGTRSVRGNYVYCSCRIRHVGKVRNAWAAVNVEVVTYNQLYPICMACISCLYGVLYSPVESLHKLVISCAGSVATVAVRLHHRFITRTVSCSMPRPAECACAVRDATGETLVLGEARRYCLNHNFLKTSSA